MRHLEGKTIAILIRAYVYISKGTSICIHLKGHRHMYTSHKAPAYVYISKGTKAKQKILCFQVHVWLHFVWKYTKANLALKSMPLCKASKPLSKM